MSCTARLLVDVPLRLLLPARHRGGSVDVGLDGSSLGHLVQSAGVPLTEADVDAEYRPWAGEVIRVPARRRPQPLPGGAERFVLDVHLGSLARRMRLLGLDTTYETEATDVDLVRRSLSEDRMLLTKDRGLLCRRARRRGAAYVRGAHADDQVADAVDRFAPTLAPLTRCPRCNGVLAAVAQREVQSVLEPGTARTYNEFARCPQCAQVYWRGAHAASIERMLTGIRRRSTTRSG